MTAPSLHTAVLSLGANIGDRWHYLIQALMQIRDWSAILRCSPVYETEPVGALIQNNFLNLAVVAETTASPSDLLRKISDIELRLGRERFVKWGPRTIDIDIIFYDQAVIRSPDLQIPHPAYANRRFVLMPLCDIIPNKVCPVLHKNMSELLQQCKDNSGIWKTNLTPPDEIFALQRLTRNTK